MGCFRFWIDCTRERKHYGSPLPWQSFVFFFCAFLFLLLEKVIFRIGIMHYGWLCCIDCAWLVVYQSAIACSESGLFVAGDPRWKYLCCTWVVACELSHLLSLQEPPPTLNIGKVDPYPQYSGKGNRRQLFESLRTVKEASIRNAKQPQSRHLLEVSVTKSGTPERHNKTHYFLWKMSLLFHGWDSLF